MEFNIRDNRVREVVCVSNKDNEFRAVDENSPLLEVGKTYTVIQVDMYDWYTDVILKEFPNVRFNSVCFNEVRGRR